MDEKTSATRRAAKAFTLSLATVWLVGMPVLAGILSIASKGKDTVGQLLMKSVKDAPSWAVSIGVASATAVQASRPTENQATKPADSDLVTARRFSDRVAAGRASFDHYQR